MIRIVLLLFILLGGILSSKSQAGDPKALLEQWISAEDRAIETVGIILELLEADAAETTLAERHDAEILKNFQVHLNYIRSSLVAILASFRTLPESPNPSWKDIMTQIPMLADDVLDLVYLCNGRGRFADLGFKEVATQLVDGLHLKLPRLLEPPIYKATGIRLLMGRAFYLRYAAILRGILEYQPEASSDSMLPHIFAFEIDLRNRITESGESELTEPFTPLISAWIDAERWALKGAQNALETMLDDKIRLYAWLREHKHQLPPTEIMPHYGEGTDINIERLDKNSRLVYFTHFNDDLLRLNQLTSAYQQLIRELVAFSRWLHTSYEGIPANIEEWIHLLPHKVPSIAKLTSCRDIFLQTKANGPKKGKAYLEAISWKLVSVLERGDPEKQNMGFKSASVNHAISLVSWRVAYVLLLNTDLTLGTNKTRELRQPPSTHNIDQALDLNTIRTESIEKVKRAKQINAEKQEERRRQIELAVKKRRKELALLALLKSEDLAMEEWRNEWGKADFGSPNPSCCDSDENSLAADDDRTLEENACALANHLDSLYFDELTKAQQRKALQGCSTSKEQQKRIERQKARQEKIDQSQAQATRSSAASGGCALGASDGGKQNTRADEDEGSSPDCEPIRPSIYLSAQSIDSFKRLTAKGTEDSKLTMLAYYRLVQEFVQLNLGEGKLLRKVLPGKKKDKNKLGFTLGSNENSVIFVPHVGPKASLSFHSPHGKNAGHTQNDLPDTPGFRKDFIQPFEDLGIDRDTTFCEVDPKGDSEPWDLDELMATKDHASFEDFIKGH